MNNLYVPSLGPYKLTVLFVIFKAVIFKVSKISSIQNGKSSIKTETLIEVALLQKFVALGWDFAKLHYQFWSNQKM